MDYITLLLILIIASADRKNMNDSYIWGVLFYLMYY